MDDRTGGALRDIFSWFWTVSIFAIAAILVFIVVVTLLLLVIK